MWTLSRCHPLLRGHPTWVSGYEMECHLLAALSAPSELGRELLSRHMTEVRDVSRPPGPNHDIPPRGRSHIRSSPLLVLADTAHNKGSQGLKDYQAENR